ncbi:dihydrolipoamide acetyltransferase family protein [Emcibacter sp. SYSU 3D8]|uniref:dihydrolipoamide acetyltransferase family protein n=1 Tax=Emcibacter sp. SYSU 3D8 TaxID=3133969 RepID=UPI0031FF2104
MSLFKLPDLGEGLQEAEIVTWHVGEGDHVVADQPLVSVETEKAVVEVPSPWSGRVKALFAQTGDTVAVGADLVDIEQEIGADTGTVVGSVSSSPAPPAAAKPAPPAAARGEVVKCTPAVRALARDLGVDLATLAPSGAHGQVTREDVEAAATGGARHEPARADLEWQKVRGVRRAMARNMAASGRSVVPATIMDEADIHGWAENADVTMRLVRAMAAGVAASPGLNAWYDAAGERLLVHPEVHLGIAVDTGDGLFVPVLNDVANRPLDDLKRGLEALKAAVRSREIPLEHLRGQTISLSNFGTLGGRHAHLAIVPPQVAIAGAGRIVRKVVPDGDGVAVHPVLPMSLTFDHRVVTGGEAARFLMALILDLEKSG